MLKADLSATLEGFRTDMATFREDAANREKEAAKRDKDNQRWIMGLVLACTAIVVGAVALL